MQATDIKSWFESFFESSPCKLRSEESKAVLELSDNCSLPPFLIVEAIRRDGAVVVSDLAESSLVDAIRAELRPQFDAYGLKA